MHDSSFGYGSANNPWILTIIWTIQPSGRIDGSEPNSNDPVYSGLERLPVNAPIPYPWNTHRHATQQKLRELDRGALEVAYYTLHSTCYFDFLKVWRICRWIFMSL